MKHLRLSIAFLTLLLVITACGTNDANTNEQANENTNQTENAVENETNSNEPANDESTAKTDGPGGFLWKVEHGDTLVYLQGTIHIGDEEFYPLDYRINEAFSASDVVLPEIDLNNQDMMEVFQYTMELATYEDGTTLKDHLPQELYEETVAAAEEIGLPIELFEMYKPWFVQTALAESLTAETGYGFEYGVDQHLLNRAQEEGKEVRELESFDEQMKLLAGFSDDIQLKLLEETLANRDKVAEETEQLVNLWKTGDVDGMVALLEVDSDEWSEEYEEYMKALNDDRNIKMTEKIMDILKEDSGQTYFVMVGSMHMIAKPSIISILEENGYEVEHIY